MGREIGRLGLEIWGIAGGWREKRNWYENENEK